jgi:hypothetical protein
VKRNHVHEDDLSEPWKCVWSSYPERVGEVPAFRALTLDALAKEYADDYARWQHADAQMGDPNP